MYTADGLLIYGGKNNTNDGFSDTWIWRNDKWDLLSSTAPARWDHGVTFMTGQHKVVVFGGRQMIVDGKDKNRDDLGDTWIFENGQWKELQPSLSPPKRSSFSISYDEGRDLVVLFGGRNGDNVLNDTWEFDGINWKQVDSPGPPQRYGHSMSYDKVTGMTYLFGGFDGCSLLGDFWQWNGHDWKGLNIESTPSPRMAHAMKFDDRGMALLIGGYAQEGVSDEIWSFNGDGWQLMETKNGPGKILSGGLGYDPQKDEFLTFGGSSEFGKGFIPETRTLAIR